MRRTLLFVAALLAACTDTPAPAAPGGGGPIGPPPIGRGRPADAGADAMGDARPDSGTSAACISVPPGDMANRASVTGATGDVFAPRSAIAYFETTSCTEQQRLVLLLSEEPSCNVRDRYFAIVVYAEEIGRLVTVGAATPLSFGGFEVFYVEGASTTTRRLWANCDGSSGLVTFSELDANTTGARQAVDFDVTLTSCGDPMPQVQVVGTIDVRLEASLADLCE